MYTDYKQFLQQELAELFASQISSMVFGGENVEIILCNNDLETLKTVKMQEGIQLGYNMREFDGVEWQFDNNVTDIQVESLKNYLKGKDYIDNKIQKVLFINGVLGLEIHLIASEDNFTDEAFKENVETIGQEIFDKVIFCDYLEVHISDDLGFSQAVYFYK